jgi:hypothetical protein
MAMEAAISSTASARPGLPRVIVAATIGNVLEWFDFLVYGFFAVTIAEVFADLDDRRDRHNRPAAGGLSCRCASTLVISSGAQ